MIRKAEKQSQCLRSGGTGQRRKRTSHEGADRQTTPDAEHDRRPNPELEHLRRRAFVELCSPLRWLFRLLDCHTIRIVAKPSTFQGFISQARGGTRNSSNVDGSNDQRQSPKIAWSGSEICFTVFDAGVNAVPMYARACSPNRCLGGAVGDGVAKSGSLRATTYPGNAGSECSLTASAEWHDHSPIRPHVGRRCTDEPELDIVSRMSSGERAAPAPRDRLAR